MIADTPRPKPRRRSLPAVLAALLAVIGVVLVTVASCSSQSGAPAPSPAAAGSLGPPTTSRTETSTDTSSESTTASSVSEPSSSAAEPPSTAAAPPDASTPPTTTAAAAPPATAGLVLPASAPVSLNIPAIGAGSPLLDLGLAADGSIEVPPINEPNSKAGWYDQSPAPGTLGPAILLGHIDSVTYGPGVFYNLGKLVPGDTIEITRADDTVAVFQVDGVRQYSKADFPTLQVYGNLDYPGLRLITCGGVFNSDTGHYESNTVVFASLVSSRSA